MAVDDVSLIRIVGRYQNQNIVNTLHWKHTAQASTEVYILETLISQFSTAVEGAWLAAHIDTYELVGYKAFRVSGAAKIPAYENRGNNGTVTGTEVPSNVCRTITLYTASANHRRRGRVMLSGSETTMFSTADGSLTTADVALLQAIGDLLDAGLAGGGDEFSVCLPATDALPVELITKSVGRVTPSAIKSRRVSQYLIG